MDNSTDPMPGATGPTASSPRVAGLRYPTPTGDPCPRTVRTDGTIENNGVCQSCGMCLLLADLVD
jgi:hypothetical protein